MHELSIAMGIVKVAEDELKKSQASRIEEIELEIGSLSGVEMQSLDFVWPMAIKGTVLETAERHVHIIKGQAHCADCERDFRIHAYFDACPACGSQLKTITHGKELKVKALVVS